MSGINVRRWLGGGVAAGVVVWVVEGLASLVYEDATTEALAAHGLAVAMSASVIVWSLVVSLIAGLVLVFLYAAARPRFGPGPRTAIVVAVALWAGGYLLSLIGYHLLGLFPSGLLTLWGAVGLLEMILAALVGGWIYREAGAPAPR